MEYLLPVLEPIACKEVSLFNASSFTEALTSASYKLREIERRVFALGQRLRHFVDYVTTTAGAANGERVRRWFQDKKAGWYTVLADPQMPATSTLLDQAHNAIE